MKKYTLIVIIFLITQSTAWGKLVNGYEKDIRQVREKLRSYHTIMNTNNPLSASDRKNIKADIKRLVAFQSYHELTERLLEQFRVISPALYNRIDSIRDAKGTPTDVYVKFIPREEALIMAGGVTSMARSNEDQGVCFSEYGKNTVSIKIWIFSKALFALAHELGHVYFQVPNFEAYTQYYKRMYHPYHSESNHVGHASNDRSGRYALRFEREFKRDYFNFLKERNNTGLDSPWVLVEDIKRRVSNATY